MASLRAREEPAGRPRRRVSVIIPTWNRAHQLHQALDSALAQTSSPYEIIVVDDGSTDDTASVVRGYRERARYVIQPNAGVSAARNNGASRAAGDLLAFLDSDDTWHPEKLSVQLAALDATPAAGWCITGCDVIGRDGHVIAGKSGWTSVFKLFDETGIDPDEFFSRHFEMLTATAEGRSQTIFTGDAWPPLFLGNFALPSSAVISRDLFIQIGGFDAAFRLAEETEFFHRLASAAPVTLIPQALVGYRVSDSGSLTSPANTVKLIGNALLSLDRAHALRTASGSSESYYQRGRQALLRHKAYAELSMKDRHGARRTVREAWAAGSPKDVWTLAMFGLSLVPGRVLDVLHQLKLRASRVAQASRTARRSPSALLP